ncbi:MAG: two-component sensor histidine kinase [Sorangiineae bacterium NIC37A_2]|jgi:two-component system phosphate regulon sensor histidine kinase PhoR|nr:MAG: two-component sensor histidine kinase [Sorangiineae bacterium NIC37A_2]
MRSRELPDLGYRRIVVLLLLLGVVPTALLLALGVVLLFLGGIEANVLMGILVLALSGATITGVILVWVFVRREANISRLQSDFVSKVSHELRTPLTSIRLFTETLSRRRGNPETEAQCIEALERESTRLAELIDRLLDWGRMESGHREFHKVKTDLRSVVQMAVEAFETTRKRRHVEFDVAYPPESIQIFADRGALSDAILNLLTNAAKYGGQPCRVTLRCAESARSVYVSVTDNGEGIPLAEHKRIFQKFYRVDDRLSREQEGSGLGLAIVHHVLKAHGGRVELSSRPGQGTTFSLVIPKFESSAKSSHTSKGQGDSAPPAPPAR